MAKNRSYKRYFIILENEDKGFENHRENLPKGYVKIEVRNGKGILNIYTQDLKYFEDAKYIYRNYLISTKEDTYVDLGTLIVDKKGRGEHKLKIDPDNVEGEGKVLEDFNVIAIVAEPLDRSSEKKVFGPLVGYINKKKTEWKPSLLKSKNKPEEVKEEVKENNKIQEAEENKKAEEVKQAKETKKVQEVKPVKEKAAEKPKEVKESKKVKEIEEIKPAKEDVEADETKKAKEKEEPVVEEKIEEKKSEKPSEAPVENIEGIEENKEIEQVEEELSEEYKEKHKKIMEIIEEGSKGMYEEKKDEEVSPQIKHENIAPEEDIKKEVESIKEEDTLKATENVEEAVEEIKQETVKKAKDNKVEEAVEKPKTAHKYKGHKEKTYNKKGNKYYGGNKPYSQYEKYYKSVHRYVKDMLKYSEAVRPFEKNIDDSQWWQMKYTQQNMHRVFLPFFGYILNIYYYNPYVFYMNNCNELMDKYGHYIFGINYDDNGDPKHYIYGVPGRYLYKEQPFRGMTGFVYWHPIEDKTPQRGDYGYWLLHIDSKTGNIVFPFEPTIPPMY